MRTHGLVLVLIAAAAAGCDSDSRPATVSRPPSIILFTADDLGWRDLGSYGDPNLGTQPTGTPGLDRLADEGMRFTHAFVTAPSCASSRATLVTGQHPHTHGVIGLTNRRPEQFSLPADTETLASILEDAGYATGVQGKWHISLDAPPHRYGYEENLSPITEWLFNGMDVGKSIDFIRRHADRPFYLEVNSKHTHREVLGDFYFDPEFRIDPDGVEIPAYWHLPDWPEIREEVARYYSQARRMDQIAGELLRTLDEVGIADDTIVIFLSDKRPAVPGGQDDPLRPRDRDPVPRPVAPARARRHRERLPHQHGGPPAHPPRGPRPAPEGRCRGVAPSCPSSSIPRHPRSRTRSSPR